MPSPPRRDVKPCVGPIPPQAELPGPSLGKDFFKVELLVGEAGTPADRHQLMLPFSQHTVQSSPLTIDSYLASTGYAFSIRVSLARPCQAGAEYGGRVYVESGLGGKDNVYRKWSNSGDASKSEDTDVDTSEADHYFWFNPGQSEHIIRGYYVSPSKSKQFVFAKPAVEGDGIASQAIINAMNEANRVGVVRVVFCEVESFEENSPKRMKFLEQQNVVPSQTKVAKEAERKVQLSAKPGSTVVDGGTISRHNAILSKHIIHERRIVYNTYEGYEFRTIGQHNNKIQFYKGTPLTVLLKENVRSRCIMTFFRSVTSNRIDLVEKERLEEVSQGILFIQDQLESDEDKEKNANSFVRVEDIVHHICQNLSPAASFIVCTGEGKETVSSFGRKTQNYGEGCVQKQKATKDERLQDFAEKERGLVSFFKQKPGTYQLVLAEGKSGKNYSYRGDAAKNYKVKLAVLELSSDESGDEA